MRSPGALWFAAALAVCLLHPAFACDRDQTGIEQPASGQAPTEGGTVFLSVVMTNHGFVRDARVLSGPASLQPAALKLVNRKKYKGRAIDQWGTTPVGRSARQMMLAVIFPKQKGSPPKIQQAMPAGVLGCVVVSRIRVSPEVMGCYLLNREESVYPSGTQEIEDRLTLRVVIDKEGNVIKAEKVSGPEPLVPDAVIALTKSKYRPYLLNGEPVEVETTVDWPAGEPSCEAGPFVNGAPPPWLFNARPVIPVLAAQGTPK